MNIERLREVADAIEKAGDLDVSYFLEFRAKVIDFRDGKSLKLDKFFMPSIYGVARKNKDDCGTAGCIAGFAISLFYPTDCEFNGDELRRILGVNRSQSNAIFDPQHVTEVSECDTTIYNSYIKERHAVKLLRSLEADDTGSEIIDKWKGILFTDDDPHRMPRTIALPMGDE